MQIRKQETYSTVKSIINIIIIIQMIGVILFSLLFIMLSNNYKIPVSYCHNINFYSKFWTLIEVLLFLYVLFSTISLKNYAFLVKQKNILLNIIGFNQALLSLFIIYSPYLQSWNRGWNMGDGSESFSLNYFRYFLGAIYLIGIFYGLRVKYFKKKKAIIFSALYLILSIIVFFVLRNAEQPPYCHG